MPRGHVTSVGVLSLLCDTYTTVFWLGPLSLRSRGSFLSVDYKQNLIYSKVLLLVLSVIQTQVRGMAITSSV